MLTRKYTAKSVDVNLSVTKVLFEKGYIPHLIKDDDVGSDMCYSDLVFVYEGANPSMGILVINYVDEVVNGTIYLETNIEAMFFNVDSRVQQRLEGIIEKAIADSEQAN